MTPKELADAIEKANNGSMNDLGVSTRQINLVSENKKLIVAVLREYLDKPLATPEDIQEWIAQRLADDWADEDCDSPHRHWAMRFLKALSGAEMTIMKNGTCDGCGAVLLPNVPEVLCQNCVREA